MTTPLSLLPKVRSKAVTDAARGQPCTLRLPGVCNFNEETVVLAHLPSTGKGMGTKSSDIHAVFACSDCHDAMDRGTHRLDYETILDAMLDALAETQSRLVEAGIITVKGAKLR